MRQGLKAAFAVTSLVTSSVALAGEKPVYKSAFGSLPKESSEDFDDTALEGGKPGVALEALNALGSFPIKTHFGDPGENKIGFTAADDDGGVPQAASKAFKIGTCSFSIKTGALSARQYTADANGNYVVLQDQLTPQSSLIATIAAPAFVSVTAEISATPFKSSKDGCKAMLKDKKKRLGHIDLADTALTLGAGGDKTVTPARVQEPAGPLVFLVWDAAADTMRLEDHAGLAPSVESAIFKMQPATADETGDLNVKVDAKLSVKKVQKKTVAGN